MQMGEFNGSCVISHLPITEGEETMLLVLKQRISFAEDRSGGLVYASDIWTPVGVPLFGTYGGYGVLESAEEDHGFQWLTQHFEALNRKSRLGFKKRGSGSKGNEISVAGLLEQLNSHRLFDSQDSKPYGFVLMLRDIYLNVLDIVARDPELEVYYREKMQEGSRNALEKVLAAKRVPVSGDEDAEARFKINSDYMDASRDFWNNEVFQVGRKSNPLRLDIVDIALKDLPAAHWLLNEMTSLAMVEDFLHDTRRAWMPQSGRGSQNREYESHQKLAEAVQSHCQRVLNSDDDDE
jgi:hypothetical protein